MSNHQRIETVNGETKVKDLPEHKEEINVVSYVKFTFMCPTCKNENHIYSLKDVIDEGGFAEAGEYAYRELIEQLQSAIKSVKLRGTVAKDLVD